MPLRSYSQDSHHSINTSNISDDANFQSPLPTTISMDEERKSLRRQKFANRRVGVSIDDLIKNLEGMDRGGGSDKAHDNLATGKLKSEGLVGLIRSNSTSNVLDANQCVIASPTSPTSSVLFDKLDRVCTIAF